LVEFSRLALQARPERLAVVPVRGVGWNGLGHPPASGWRKTWCLWPRRA